MAESDARSPDPSGDEPGSPEGEETEPRLLPEDEAVWPPSGPILPPGGIKGKHRLLLRAGTIALILAGTVMLLALWKQQRDAVRLAQAKAAYEAAALAFERDPDDLDGAIARFGSVQSGYPGTEWAKRAASNVREFQRQKAEEAAHARAEEELKRDLPVLQSRVMELLAKDRFAEALWRIDAFERKHPSEDAREEAAGLRDEALARAEDRYAELARAAKFAIELKDFPAAREALKPALSFGVPGLAERARKKLAEIDSREKNAEQWARWEAIRARSERLAKAGIFREAFDALEGAKALPLENIASMVAEAKEALEGAERQATAEAVAAYAERSDEVWMLFRERKYAEAAALLDGASSRPEYDLATELMEADRAAAELLRAFWAAVEQGIAARIGKSFVVGGAGGNILGFQNGELTLRMGKVEFRRRVDQLATWQAVACAGLKDDPCSMGMLGVFLLVEGREAWELEKARNALDAAADTPGLGIYREKLATRKRYLAEEAAKAAWNQIAPLLDEFMDEALAQNARPMLDGFQADHANTEFIKQVATEMATLRERIASALGGPCFILRVTTRTSDHPQAGSRMIAVDVLLNGYEPHRRRLVRPSQQCFRRGAADTFEVKFPGAMPSIQGIKVEAQGTDAWKCRYIVFQFLEGGRKSEAYRFPVNKVFSSVAAHLKRGATTNMWFPFLPKLQ